MCFHNKSNGTNQSKFSFSIHSFLMTKLIFTGVYFTAMSPSEGKEEIKQNNWDGNWSGISDTKVQAAVKVSIPTDEVYEYLTKGGREIYMTPGDMDLRAYSHKANYEIEWDETTSTEDETTSTEDETTSTEDETTLTEDETTSTEDETSSSED